jgi:hypothetical protein
LTVGGTANATGNVVATGFVSGASIKTGNTITFYNGGVGGGNIQSAQAMYGMWYQPSIDGSAGVSHEWVSAGGGGLMALNTGGGLTINGLQVNGNAGVTGTMSAGTVTQTSDENRKKNWIEPDSATLVAELSMIEKWGSFDWTDGGTSIGIGAQSLQKIEGLDAAVHRTAFGALSVNYGGAAMVAAVALAKEVEALKELVHELRRKK